MTSHETGQAPAGVTPPGAVLASLPRQWRAEAKASDPAYGNGLRDCARELDEVLRAEPVSSAPQTLSEALGLTPEQEVERRRGLERDFGAIRAAERAAYESVSSAGTPEGPRSIEPAIEAAAKAIGQLLCVQAGWAFGVPEDGRREWLQQVAWQAVHAIVPVIRAAAS